MRKPFNILTLVCVALFPVLSLYSNNIDQIEFGTTLRVLIFALVASLIVFGLLVLITRDNHRSLIVTIALILLFFSYGHVYGMIKNSTLLGVSIGRHRFLVLLWLFLFLLVSWLTFSKLKNLDRVLRTILPISIVLVFIPLSNILWFGISENAARPSGRSINTLNEKVQKLNQQISSLPDIYYIILDGYPRQDTLKEVFNFNSDPFLIELEELGFYVARCSQSNYAQTELSLASVLNMAYLEDLGDEFEPNNRNRLPLRELIKQSKTRQLLTELGYSTIACVFRTIPSTDSDEIRPLIPAQTVHRFRCKSSTDSGACRPL